MVKEREQNPCLAVKGELGSDEIAMFLTLPCVKRHTWQNPRSVVQTSYTNAPRNDRLQSTWVMSFSIVHICIAFRLLRRGRMKLHALLGHPVAENFVSWCETWKNSSASFLFIQETYRSSARSRNLKVIKKCVHFIWFEVYLCMMSGQLISDFVR
jgi:hypothetical protein